MQTFLPNGFEASYDDGLAESVRAFSTQLSAARAQRLKDLLEQGAEDAQQAAAGFGSDGPRTTRNRGASSREPGEALGMPAGGEDPEWDPAFGGLQHELTELIDEEKAEELLATLARHNETDARSSESSRMLRSITIGSGR